MRIGEGLSFLSMIVPAKYSDSAFVATVMMEAVEIPMMEEHRVPEDHLVAICQHDDTLYSWRNASLYMVNDKPVAGLISYTGNGYHEVKVRTFKLVPPDVLDFDPFTMDDETRDGEYYLDSLAVLPEYRGRGIGTALLRHGIEIARSQGLLPILACDPENKNAYRLYCSLGFKTEGTLNIFGQEYLRMVWR